MKTVIITHQGMVAQDAFGHLEVQSLVLNVQVLQLQVKILWFWSMNHLEDGSSLQSSPTEGELRPCLIISLSESPQDEGSTFVSGKQA